MLTASLIWTVVGLFVGGIVLLGSRGWGSMYRGMASHMLGVDVPAPARFVWPKGFWRKLGALFVDGDAWRALLFMLVSFPLALAASYISTAVLVIALGSITYPIWRPFVPAQQATDGSWHRGSMLGTDYFIDTPARIMMQVLVGIGPAARVALDCARLCAAVSGADSRAAWPHTDGPAGCGSAGHARGSDHRRRRAVAWN